MNAMKLRFFLIEYLLFQKWIYNIHDMKFI